MARRVNPELRSNRAKRDDKLRPEIERIWKENRCVYGTEKFWRQSDREDGPVVRCTVERLMREIGNSGVRRGKRFKITIPDEAADRSADLVSRQFVADLTDVSTWRVSNSPRTNLVLDTLEQALHARSDTDGLIHHGDRGCQYLSIR